MDARKRLFYWIFAGSTGGANRARIVDFIKETPSNLNRIAEGLALDYKTVKHHVGVLLDNNLVTTMGGGYGKTYFVSPFLEENYGMFL